MYFEHYIIVRQNAHTTDTLIARLTINEQHLTVNVLLDTGALGENDYMNSATADWLHANGVVLHDSGLTRVCGAFAGNSCQISSQTVKHPLTFLKSDLINLSSNETYSFVFKVVKNIDYDIIIGRKTIIDNNLWHLFPKSTSMSTVLPDNGWKTVKPKRKLYRSDSPSTNNLESSNIDSLYTSDPSMGSYNNNKPGKEASVKRGTTSNPPVLGNNLTELASRTPCTL